MAKQFTAIYVRVSTADQSHASQEPDLKRWVEANVPEGQEVRWYHEKFTGRTMNRPKWRELENEILAGRVERIVVWRLDRLGRTTRGLLKLFEQLEEIGVGFVSLREQVSFDTPAGRLMLTIIASIAQYESEVRGERVRAGLAAVTPERRAKWKPRGNKQGTVMADPATLKDLQQLVESGVPLRRIARMFHMDVNTIYKYIRQLKWQYKWKEPHMRKGGKNHRQSRGATNVAVKLKTHQPPPKFKPAVQDPMAAAMQRLIEGDE